MLLGESHHVTSSISGSGRHNGWSVARYSKYAQYKVRSGGVLLRLTGGAASQVPADATYGSDPKIAGALLSM